MEKITTVLFDLDGTLIPFDQKEFIESYLYLISKKFVPMGYDKDMLIKALWDGTGNMIKNDGKVMNRDIFKSTFTELMEKEYDEMEGDFMEFYEKEFDDVKETLQEEVDRAEFIKTINIVYLSTENSNKKPENVTIEVLENTITNKAAEILITDNNKNQYGWGVEFRVQQKIDGKWKELNYISDDLAWIEIAYELDKNNQVKMKVDFEKYYGILKRGIYRIVKPVYDNGYIDLYSNEFEIK